MCVIAYKPKGVVLSRSDLWEMNNSNPHGMGVAYQQGKSLFYDKEMPDKPTDFRKFIVRNTIAMGPDVEATWHFRIATAGGVSVDKCHPFVIGHSMFMPNSGKTKRPLLFHNGDISHYLGSQFNRILYSDTQYGATTLFRRLFEQYSYEKVVECIPKLSRYFSYNKFVIMFPDKPSILIGSFYEDKSGFSTSNNFWNNRTIKINGGWWNFD